MALPFLHEAGAFLSPSMPMTTRLDPPDDALGPLQWPMQAGVRAWMSTRRWPTGLAEAVPIRPSLPPFDDANLGDHVGDDPATVAAHRLALSQAMQADPVWLRQVHGHRVVQLGRDGGGGWQVDGQAWDPAQPVEADGSWTTEPGVVCTVMVADCLPVLLAAPQGRGVAALHAGWRGLAGAGSLAGQGVLESGVAALCAGASCEPAELQAWLGPCIGPQSFEVSEDVLRGFGVDPDAAVTPHFQLLPSTGQQTPRKWLADLPGLARQRLAAQGVSLVAGGRWCTVSDASRFFSFRRDRVTGRQAACIWLERGSR